MQAAVQPFGKSCMENKNDTNLFSRLIVRNRQRGAKKSYMIDSILITVVNEHHFDEECFLKLSTSGKTACLIGEYTIYIHYFGMGIPTDNTKLK